MSEHIDKILGVLRPYTLHDIQTIKKLTGEPDVRYYDIAYLKERVKGILLSRDPNMLTCFTLQNVIKGLMIMAAEIFGQEIDLKTIIMTITDNDVKVEESRGFNLTQQKLRGLKEDQVPLLEVSLKGRGKIYIDLFYRKHKHHKN